MSLNEIVLSNWYYGRIIWDYAKEIFGIGGVGGTMPMGGDNIFGDGGI